jgi:hypothetical protein
VRTVAKAKKTSLTMTVRIEGVEETLRAFRQLPKDANNELRDRAKSLAQTLAGKVKAAAASDPSPQAALLVPTIRARRDRVPVIAAGGSKRVGRKRVPAWAVLFGAEFGSNRFTQFGKPHSGRQGSWLFGVADREAATIEREWNAAADEVARRWATMGGR